MKILVFGGNGFLGKEIKNLSAGTKFVIYSASRSNLSDYKIDISDFNSFKKLPLNYFDIIINCASVLPGGDILDEEYLINIFKSNILGTQNICKWVINQKSIKKIINCSTLAVVNKPWQNNLKESDSTYPKGKHVLYCSSKLMQELIIDTVFTNSNIDFINLRFSSIYGKNMPKTGVIWSLYTQAKHHNCIKITNGTKVSFDFLNVIDAARIILTTISSKQCDQILNAASGKEVTLFKLASLLAKNVPGRVTIINEEQTGAISSFSNINVYKLDKIINTRTFVPLKTGISEIVKLW
jgi:UDP-glucose 4-epimerase